MAAEGKGAIGAFAPSGLGYVWEHEILDPKLFSILFDQGNSILGSLTTEAKIATYAQGVTEDVVKTFTLFGDPACRLKISVPIPLAIFASDFGRTNCDQGDPCEGDFDGDGDVDGSDLAVFAADFGRTDCPVTE